MKLQQLLTEKISQVFTATWRRVPAITYTFVLRKVGVDGKDRPIYVGDCAIFDENSEAKPARHKSAVVMRADGTLYAAFHTDHLEDAVQAAGLAIASQRKAFGRGHANPLENWTTYREQDLQVEGYDASID